MAAIRMLSIALGNGLGLEPSTLGLVLPSCALNHSGMASTVFDGE